MNDTLFYSVTGLIIFFSVICIGVTIYFLAQGKNKRNIWPVEKNFDPNIITPSQPIFLTKFSFSPMLGNACCRPMWYAFRYVTTDGNYGKFGPWTNIPVRAGGLNQPCINNDCSTKCLINGESQYCVLTGNPSCECNRPEIGVMKELDYNTKLGHYYAVIHRQLDSFDPDSEGRPIGILIPSPFDPRGIKYFWVDTLYNENDGSGCDFC